MNCEEFNQLREKYLRGETTSDEEKEIEAHLESCADCQQSLDQSLAESDKGAGPRPDKATVSVEDGLSESRQRRILRWAKYRHRFSMALFLFLLFAVLNWVGSFVSSYYFNWGGEEARLYKAQKTAGLLTELCFPNVGMAIVPEPFKPGFSSAGWGHSRLEIKPYLAALGDYALEKKVGRETFVIGHLQVNHLLGMVGTQWQWQDGAHENNLYFYHPEQVSEAESGDRTQLDEGVWQALEILPEGTVAELAVSFSQCYSIEQVKNLLKDYDLEITWYAISTGLEAELPPEGRDHQAPLMAFNGAWGVPDLSHNMLNEYSLVNSEDSTVREEYFLDAMKFLMENEQLARKLYRGPRSELRLNERYAYVQENGLQVYGVVVTGPTKELLKLQQLETVHFPALGEVRLWNWFQRSASGVLY